MSEHEESVEGQDDSATEEEPKKVNVGGLAMLALVAFALSIPMFVGVIRGVSNGDVWDPNTGERVVEGAAELDTCERTAAILLRESSAKAADWQARRDAWSGDCATKKPELEQMLVESGAEGE